MRSDNDVNNQIEEVVGSDRAVGLGVEHPRRQGFSPSQPQPIEPQPNKNIENIY